MNPFNIIRRWIFPPTLTPPKYLSELPEYKTVGRPWITNEMIDANPQWLETERVFTQDNLRHFIDPAYFTNQRSERALVPTPAVWIDNLSGRVTPMSPRHLTSLSQAAWVFSHLNNILKNEDPNDLILREIMPQNPFSRIDWRGEQRRHFYVGPRNAGLVRLLYAKYPVETADNMLIHGA
jgi:hypothetical protein